MMIMATLQQSKNGKPFHIGAKEKTTLFRLNLMAAYDSNFLYHVSCYETLKDAIDKLRGFSCGTFLKDEQ